MLPAGRRLRTRADHLATVRGGRRAGKRTLVVHLLPPADPMNGSPPPGPRSPVKGTRAGFVVSKAIGDSVTRHRVVRRLRALVATRLERLEPGTRLVVRALPPAATATSADLGGDLDAALDRVLRAPEPRR